MMTMTIMTKTTRIMTTTSMRAKITRIMTTMSMRARIMITRAAKRDNVSTYTNGTVEIVGGACTRDSAGASIRPIGDHGNLVIDLTYTCTAPDAIEAIEVSGFQTFAGFEEVNAVFLTDAGQTAESLTESDTRLDIN